MIKASKKSQRDKTEWNEHVNTHAVETLPHIGYAMCAGW